MFLNLLLLTTLRNMVDSVSAVNLKPGCISAALGRYFWCVCVCVCVCMYLDICMYVCLCVYMYKGT